MGASLRHSKPLQAKHKQSMRRGAEPGQAFILLGPPPRYDVAPPTLWCGTKWASTLSCGTNVMMWRLQRY